MSFKLRKPSIETTIRFVEWVRRSFSDPEDAKTVADRKRGVICSKDATVGILLTMTKRKKISRWFVESLGFGAIDAKKMVFGTEYVNVNGIIYQTKLVSGILISLGTDFGDCPIYQGDKEKHPLLFITNKVNEVGIIAPLMEPTKKEASS